MNRTNIAYCLMMMIWNASCTHHLWDVVKHRPFLPWSLKISLQVIVMHKLYRQVDLATIVLVDGVCCLYLAVFGSYWCPLSVSWFNIFFKLLEVKYLLETWWIILGEEFFPMMNDDHLIKREMVVLLNIGL